MAYIGIKHRRDTAANWTANNPTLLAGQFGFETDSYTDSGSFRYYKAKFGTGTDAWNDLPYMRLAGIGGGGGASAFTDLTDVFVSYPGNGGKYIKIRETEDGLEMEFIEAADLPSGIDASKIGDGSVSNAEFAFINSLTSNAQTQLNNKAALVHIHAIGDVTGLQTALDGKQAVGNYFDKSSDDADDITPGATNKFATQAEKDKLSNITITQPVDLDAIETRVNELDAAVILKGTWAANAGTFPGAGAAQAGWSYIVSIAGTVDGQSFSVNDRIIAITDNASTTTFASNWFKADYTDLVTSFDGQTGAITLGAVIAALSTKDNIHDNDTFGFSDSENSNASKKTAWSNIKSKIKSYYDAVASTFTNKTFNLTDNTLSGTTAQFNAALSDGDFATLAGGETLTNKTINLSSNTLSTTLSQLNTALSDANLIPEAGGTFTGDISVPDEAYDSTNWNGSLEVPTKNAIRDKIESMSAGGLTYWTETYSNSSPNDTVQAVRLKVTSSDTNIDAVLSAKGNGATLADLPDGTTTGGDKRGQYATDWQKSRGASSYVAGANYSTIGGGRDNKTLGTYATIAGGIQNYTYNTGAYIGGGYNNQNGGSYSVIGGGESNIIDNNDSTISGGASNRITSYYGSIGGGNGNRVQVDYGVISGGSQALSYLLGQHSWATGQIASRGDAQGSKIILRRSITGTSETELFLDGSSVRAIIPDGKTWDVLISVAARVTTQGNGTPTVGESHGSKYLCTIARTGTSTVLVGTVQQIGSDNNSTNMGGSDVTITADDTNEALKITFTPATTAGSTTVTKVSAVVHLTEIA